MAFTPEDVKSKLVMLVGVVKGLVNFLPGSFGSSLKTMVTVVEQLAEQEWFVQLICFVLNTFGGKEANHADVNEALSAFGLQLVTSGAGPTEFVKE